MKGKNTLRRSLAKIAMHTMVAIFSLASVFAGTYAWFSLNDNASVTGATIKIVDPSTAVVSISVHEFYGATENDVTWGFNPVANHTATIDPENNTGSESAPFSMGSYTLEDPHHPVLYLLETNGNNELIKLKTNYCYLAKSEPAASVTVNTYSALTTYAENTIVKVVADERHGGASTVYKYVGGSFEMQWIALHSGTDNPLSSIIQMHSFIFNYDPTTTNTVTGNLMINGAATQKTYIPITKSSCLSTYTNNMSSFVSLNGGTPVFSNETTVYDGQTYANGYLGIVYDYYPELVEELYSYFLGNTLLNTALGFSCDWSMEI